VNASNPLSQQRSLHVILEHLGQPGSRNLIPTPALLCDLELLIANIERMAGVTSSGGVGLRPHVKSHKSAFIARLQLERGAVGLCFAKLSEAETVVGALVAEGVDATISALLTSPLVGARSAERAAALGELCDLLVVVDDPRGVDELSNACEGAGRRLSALCDVDVGLARTGVVDAAHALSVTERIERSPWLDFVGVQGYGGHLQHIAGREERREATKDSTRRLELVVAALTNVGLEVPIRTGGGTGTAGIDIELGLLTELQAGSYVFMDREYRDALGVNDEGSFAQSLMIATTVISANQKDFVTVDAGLKAMANDAGSPLVVGHEATSQYHFFGDEHGLVTTPASTDFRRGDRLELVPPHCDPTVDRYDHLWMVQGDVLVDVVEVTARGCSQ
jgi:D-serine deaminase-like pyridoxal phosphate-dependent protein